MNNPNHTRQILAISLSQLFKMQHILYWSPTGFDSLVSHQSHQSMHLRYQRRSVWGARHPQLPAQSEETFCISCSQIFHPEHITSTDYSETWKALKRSIYISSHFLVLIQNLIKWLKELSTPAASRNLTWHRNLMHNKYVYACILLFKIYTYIFVVIHVVWLQQKYTKFAQHFWKTTNTSILER